MTQPSSTSTNMPRLLPAVAILRLCRLTFVDCCFVVFVVSTIVACPLLHISWFLFGISGGGAVVAPLPPELLVHCIAIIAFPFAASFQQPLSSTSSYRCCLLNCCTLVDCCFPLVTSVALSPLCHQSCLYVAMLLLLFHLPCLFSSSHPPSHPTIVACPAAVH